MNYSKGAEREEQMSDRKERSKGASNASSETKANKQTKERDATGRELQRLASPGSQHHRLRAGSMRRRQLLLRQRPSASSARESDGFRGVGPHSESRQHLRTAARGGAGSGCRRSKHTIGTCGYRA